MSRSHFSLRDISHLCYIFLTWTLCGSAAAADLQPVALQLKWKHQFQFAGYYAAEAKGYYRDAGLDVKFIEAHPGEDVADAVLEGKAAFGVGTTDLLLRHARGQPVVVLGVIFQHSPLALMALNESGIGNLHQIAGHKVMIEPGSAELFAYLQREGIATGRLTLVTHSFDPASLTSGQVDAMSVYTTDEPYALAKAGRRISLFSPRSGGIDFYGDNFFTTKGYLEKHPEQVAAFREASLRGWQYAMQHPAEIVDLILARYHPQKTRDQLLFEAEQMAPLIQANLIEPGYMHPGRWHHIAEVYDELGMLPAQASVEGFIYAPPANHLPPWILAASLGGLALAAMGGIAFLFIFSANRRLAAEVARRRETEASLQASEERYRFTYEAAPLAFILVDNANCITGWNRQAEAIFGWMAAEILGQSVERLIPAKELSHLHALLHDSQRNNQTRQTTLHNTTRDGRKLVCEWTATRKEGGDHGTLCLVQDVTERHRMREALETANDSLRTQIGQIQLLQNQLLDQALRDPLSGVYNRRYLQETETRELARAQREDYAVAYLLIDIDRFKEINDGCGHETGDQVLSKVAAVLGANSRTEDIVCRFGGDEFLVLLPRISEAVALQRAEALRQACLGLAIDCGKPMPPITLSVGVALYPAHGSDGPSVLRAADSALYRAKAEGRNRVCLARSAPELPAAVA